MSVGHFLIQQVQILQMASTSSTSSTSQPIALPIVHHGSSGSYLDYQMGDGSYTSSSGPFNPASYTRHFLGSPISWRGSSFNAGSFTHRIPEHSFQGSIEYVLIRFRHYRPVSLASSANEMRYGRALSSSQENRESILNALNLFDREGELVCFRLFSCLPAPVKPIPFLVP